MLALGLDAVTSGLSRRWMVSPATINGFQAGDQLAIEGETIVSDSVTGSVLNLFGAGGTDLGQLTFSTEAGAIAAENSQSWPVTRRAP